MFQSCFDFKQETNVLQQQNNELIYPFLTLLGTAGRFGRPTVRISRPFGIMFENFFRHDPVTPLAASPRLRAYHMFNLRTKE